MGSRYSTSTSKDNHFPNVFYPARNSFRQRHSSRHEADWTSKMIKPTRGKWLGTKDSQTTRETADRLEMVSRRPCRSTTTIPYSRLLASSLDSCAPFSLERSQPSSTLVQTINSLQYLHPGNFATVQYRTNNSDFLRRFI